MWHLKPSKSWIIGVFVCGRSILPLPGPLPMLLKGVWYDPWGRVTKSQVLSLSTRKMAQRSRQGKHQAEQDVQLWSQLYFKKSTARYKQHQVGVLEAEGTRCRQRFREPRLSLSSHVNYSSMQTAGPGSPNTVSAQVASFRTNNQQTDLVLSCPYLKINEERVALGS